MPLENMSLPIGDGHNGVQLRNGPACGDGPIRMLLFVVLLDTNPGEWKNMLLLLLLRRIELYTEDDFFVKFYGFWRKSGRENYSIRGLSEIVDSFFFSLVLYPLSTCYSFFTILISGFSSILSRESQVFFPSSLKLLFLDTFRTYLFLSTF